MNCLIRFDVLFKPSSDYRKCALRDVKLSCLASTCEHINSILIFYRICGNSGGETFTKQNLGPTNMMIVRFYSDRYDTVSPENGFELSVTAAPSGTLLNLINACRKKTET